MSNDNGSPEAPENVVKFPSKPRIVEPWSIDEFFDKVRSFKPRDLICIAHDENGRQAVISSPMSPAELVFDLEIAKHGLFSDLLKGPSE